MSLYEMFYLKHLSLKEYIGKGFVERQGKDIQPEKGGLQQSCYNPPNLIPYAH